ncbi:hypothetical protein BJV82DRAFT_662669 [Fennellomyces sp. T-0311]|nr:hypothetical protein BJV82DRAFT_662669 [Fennellomyces sp. T-0311]
MYAQTMICGGYSRRSTSSLRTTRTQPLILVRSGLNGLRNKIIDILDHVLEDIKVFAGRYRPSAATSKRVNAGWAVTGSAIVPSKKVGKHDCIASSTKEIIESQLLTPKTMKDMFNMAVENANNNSAVTHALKIVAFNHTGLKMKMSIMNCPRGYVCRLVKALEYEIPKNPGIGFRDLLAILQMTLKAKLLVKDSIDLLEGYQKGKASIPMLEIMDNSDTIYLPTCLSASLLPVADASTAARPSGSSL